jgi:hypothetical protein
MGSLEGVSCEPGGRGGGLRLGTGRRDLAGPPTCGARVDSWSDLDLTKKGFALLLLSCDAQMLCFLRLAYTQHKYNNKVAPLKKKA